MASLLKGVGFITGAASGIGKATAISFARHGAIAIAIGDVNGSAIKEAAAEIKKSFPNVEVLPLELDVSNERSVDDAVAQAATKLGRIDYGINNAGIGGSQALSADHSLADWQKVMDINLNGVWMSSRAQIRQMLKQEPLEPSSYRSPRGAIVNVASMYGIVGTSREVPAIAYVASKHAVVGMTKGDAIAYAKQGIRINAICPGYVATPLLKASTASEVMQEEIAKAPAGRVAEMEEISDVISFLVSSLSSFMNGASLVVDGGYTIQ